VLWQCGGGYIAQTDAFMAAHRPEQVRHSAFLKRMDLAYAVADVVISRSGASSVSEICAAGKAAVFVPSPNVAEDHQTHNAMALVNKDAALMVRDVEAQEKLIPLALTLAADDAALQRVGANAKAMGLPDSAKVIAEEVLGLIEN